MSLKIGVGLNLPVEAVTEKLGFLGRTGSGKTYAAQKLAEEMHRAHGQFVVLDPVGVWFGLRLAADGKKPGLPIPVLGGLHGDIPLESGAGALVANLIVDSGSSMVLDVSQFESDADKARFAKAFADRFFFRKKASPSAVHVFIEEAQEFIPQNPQREEGQMLHAFTRMIKIGRNFGIGVSMISQRPQELNKKCLNQTELLFCFQLTGPQERKTIQGWIAEKGIDEDIASELPKLGRGEPHVWSPAWLKISKRVLISEKETFDASSTPKIGGKADTRALSPIDLAAFRSQMESTIERAKQEDPKALRGRIAELEKQLRTRQPAVAVKQQKVTRVEVPILKDAHVKRFEVSVCRVEKIRDDTLKAIGKMVIAAGAVEELIQKQQHPLIQVAADGLHRMNSDALGWPMPPAGTPSGKQWPPDRLGRPPDWHPTERSTSSVSVTTGGAPKRILAALAWWSSAGITTPQRVQVAFVAGYTVNGHFNNVLGSLRSEGLIDYPGDGAVSLTASGREKVEMPEAPGFEDLIARIRSVLKDQAKRRLFDALLDRWRSGHESMLRPELATAAGYTVNGHFNNMLGSLRSLGVVEYAHGGVRLAPWITLGRN